MIKLIIIILIAWLGFSIWRKFKQSKSNNATRPLSNKMLSCSVCETHIPESEAIIKNDKVFCCKKCSE
ncbi:PP0621 family protein [Candidatus Thioglobus sp.]